MIDYVKIALLVLGLFKSFVSWMHDKKLLQQGERDAALQGLKDAEDAIAKAQSARLTARADNASGDPRVRDDGYERND